MRAASATLRTNIGTLLLSEAQRSHCLSSGSVLAEHIICNIHRGATEALGCMLIPVWGSPVAHASRRRKPDRKACPRRNDRRFHAREVQRSHVPHQEFGDGPGGEALRLGPGSPWQEVADRHERAHASGAARFGRPRPAPGSVCRTGPLRGLLYPFEDCTPGRGRQFPPCTSAAGRA